MIILTRVSVIVCLFIIHVTQSSRLEGVIVDLIQMALVYSIVLHNVIVIGEVTGTRVTGALGIIFHISL